MRTCTRKLEFDAGHRVMHHESKCRHPHGHRYVAEITAAASDLDDLGRVVDFGVIKAIVGQWIDDSWDHATIVNMEDDDFIRFLDDNEYKAYAMKGNPTAENMVKLLFKTANSLLLGKCVKVVHVRLYETPNCWADFSEGSV